jgi:ankyrin repeat protein
MYAASVGHIDILKFLMEKGCDLEAKNEDGFTALHWAAYVGNLDSCKTLIEKGANLKAKNSEGKKPADLAETQEVKKFIKDAIEKQKKAGEAEAPPAQ